MQKPLLLGLGKLVATSMTPVIVGLYRACCEISRDMLSLECRNVLRLNANTAFFQVMPTSIVLSRNGKRHQDDATCASDSELVKLVFSLPIDCQRAATTRSLSRI